ncbi:hypothetical protein A2738_00820 [Candidatus Nomurabacteria bacterium RIFCSPHIGHO2_01_FULL_42_15]|uniref:Glycerate kinase n=1 Tax=Candidatus Nomurabacteria bacterium RIFCSPHIGHO2_01_FULL_42_15 TaxID=1801742 RepID=A0A1F6VFS4_9BACT|nr:MAG: hypothetical protein A2738_00820 [Candidatus Nomurabacteria bacterium RIFCSPHIGHO2_01_FULL_42_15]OGI93160.1 MAG: hypothetical protein A3A99_01350 [Candidatus Nomurabacteria bacterium RIFCSPLOWO2_01_FULL_41_18]
MKRWIKNQGELATTENRKLALAIIEAGLSAIDTEEVISRFVKPEGDLLTIMGESFDLSKFKKIKVVGFGKASARAALALEKILGPKIETGAVVGLAKISLDYIDVFAGSHPRPSMMNVEAGEKIYEILKNGSEDDLIIVLVSGGGSALLCYSKEECEQNMALYDEFLKCGGTIEEINTVRKHLSILKGGGLAKVAYPANVVGLIFSDIPGDHFADVASGPTYKDESTVADAAEIIRKYNLGKFDLIETPKEDKYFEKVRNFVLVSNKTAISAMAEKSEELGLKANILSTDMYDEIDSAVGKIFKAEAPDTTVLAAGEPEIKVARKGGKGGRNLHMALRVIKKGMIGEDSVFVSLASDGMDNSDAAGAIADKKTIEKIKNQGIDIDDHLERFDSYPVFQKSGDIIMTGATGANVSDLMILLKKK